jgi:hypothetical protein
MATASVAPGAATSSGVDDSPAFGTQDASAMAGADTELALVTLGAMLSPTTVSFSVLALVLAARPLRSGILFYLGALTTTLFIGILGALVLGDAAASRSGGTKTWVAIVDVALGAFMLSYAVKLMRRPRDPARAERMVEKMRAVVVSSPAAIFFAGATLANAGAFIPIALKDLSQENLTTAEFLASWAVFAVLALLPLAAALILLLVAPDRAGRTLDLARGWLEGHLQVIAGVLVIVVAAALLRNGIAGLL